MEQSPDMLKHFKCLDGLTLIVVYSGKELVIYFRLILEARSDLCQVVECIVQIGLLSGRAAEA